MKQLIETLDARAEMAVAYGIFLICAAALLVGTVCG